ncbi:MAG: ATP-binding protein, partial [Pirellulales bacterium]
MDKHPPEPLLAHELPPAPSFFGRDRELDELRDAWAGGFCGVLALVGLGGAGKTALAARFLDELCQKPGSLPPCDGLLAWSFYRDQDAGGFLQEACAYFCQG